MSKKLCFRGPLDRQRRMCIETLLESEWQHLFNKLLVTMKVVALENVTFSDTQNLKTVC